MQKSESGFQLTSIHTPTKGVTFTKYQLYNVLGNFNPHSHEGSDEVLFIQAHNNVYFNPHSHEGSDLQMNWWKAL